MRDATGPGAGNLGGTMSLKSRLRSGDLTVGAWLTLGSEAIAEICCDAGFDWIAVDLEHSTTSLAATERIVRVVDRAGKTPLVRLADHDATAVQHVMDAGAHGVIVPRVTGRDTLDTISRAMHYPPRGARGVGLARAQGYGARFDEYRAWLERDAVLVAIVEHVDAIETIDAIAGFSDLDACFVGPYDLSASMGFAGQTAHPDVVAACRTVVEACARHGRAPGVHVVEPDPATLEQRVAEGHRFIAYGTDFRMIDAASRAGLRGLRR